MNGRVSRHPLRRARDDRTVTGAPRQLLRLEGLLVLVAASVTYGRLEAGWWPFALLFFAPDLTLLGYGAGRAAGAALYNAGHWYGLPAVCVAWGVLAQAPEILAAGLIWAAHIGFDRASATASNTGPASA